MNLKQIRLSKGIKQTDIAEFLGITQPAYANYERGVRQPDPDTLKKLANYLNVSVDYLLGRTDTPTTPSNDKQPKETDAILYGITKDLTKEELNKVSEYVQFLKSQRTKRIHLAPGTELAALGGDFACAPSDDEPELL